MPCLLSPTPSASSPSLFHHYVVYNTTVPPPHCSPAYFSCGQTLQLHLTRVNLNVCVCIVTDIAHGLVCAPLGMKTVVLSVFCCLLGGLMGLRKQYISVWPWIFCFGVFDCVPCKIPTGAQKQVHYCNTRTRAHTRAHAQIQTECQSLCLCGALRQGCAVIGYISQYRRPWTISVWFSGQSLRQKMDSLYCAFVYMCLHAFLYMYVWISGYPIVICICMHYIAGILSESTEHWREIS